MNISRVIGTSETLEWKSGKYVHPWWLPLDDGRILTKMKRGSFELPWWNSGVLFYFIIERNDHFLHL